MKKLNKKGFTIVELVIVIAVIAILAGVLIPTFATVVEKANQSKAMQEAKNAYELYLSDYVVEGAENSFYIKANDYYFEVDGNGQFQSTALKSIPANAKYIEAKSGAFETTVASDATSTANVPNFVTAPSN